MKSTILYLEQQSWRAGAQRVLDEVLQALAKDYTPLVAFPDDGPYAAELRSHDIETLFYPLGTYRAGAKSAAEMAGFTLRSAVCGIVLAKLIRRRNVRLVYINGPRCLPAGVLAARLTGTPSVFHLHRTLVRKADLLVATRAAARASRIVACSEAAAQSLTAAFPPLSSKLQVIYNPVRVNRVRQREGTAEITGGPVIGMVARITPSKGQMTLVRSVALIRECWPGLQVLLVGAPEPHNSGDAAYLAELRAAVAKLGLTRNVHFTGYHSDLARYYARFNVFCIPSIDDGEGLPMVALEALAWGVPVVGSRWAGIAEVVKDEVNGLLFSPGDEGALAAALTRILWDRELRGKLRSGAAASLDDRFAPHLFRRAIRDVVGSLVRGIREVAGDATCREVVAKA